VIRLFVVLTLLAPLGLVLVGCGPSYSPNTYASNAAQQANKVESGVVAGIRKVRITTSGTVGGVAGAAAGGVAGAQVGVGPTSAFSAIGGSLVGGIAGVATEHIVGDTNGFEYIVRKANGDMISVVQKDEKPLRVGEKVLVIAGPQARIVPDYTVPFDAPDKAASQSAAPAATSAPSHPSTPSAGAVPPVAGVPPQLPGAFSSPTAAPPPIITPSEVPAAPSASASPTEPATKP
jgi:outer membrane lipoprotein SlyB